MFFAMDNKANEPNFSNYMVKLGKGTQPATYEQMGTLKAIGCYFE